MKQDKNNDSRDYDECSCSGVDTHNSENDENSDGWQTIQEEDCCSCCSTSELSRDEDTNIPNRDASNEMLQEQRYSDCCQKYAWKEEKNGKGKATRMRRNGVAGEEGQSSRREVGTVSYSNGDCDQCQETGFFQDDDRRRRVRHGNEEELRSCSCVGTVKKTNKKRSRIHRRRNRTGRQTANGTCSCITVRDQQQYPNYCTCSGYSNSSVLQQTIPPPPPSASADCSECANVSEIRYNNVSCQTCQSEDIQSGGETILLPRVTLRAPEDRDDCEQCRRERTMFERLSDQTVQSTIDETFKKLIRKTLEMYPAAQRATQPANNLNYRPLMTTDIGSLLPQQSSQAMELCTCALKSCNQNGVSYTGTCRECVEVTTNCQCEECTDFQGNESCEECAKENMERNACKLCVNDETNETCEQCETDSDDNNDSSDTCCDCCKCHCWKNDKPRKDDDFLF